MAEKKKVVEICPVCQKPIIWVKYANGKAKMCKQCDCGIFNRSGQKIS
jgi:hypothetical protein